MSDELDGIVVNEELAKKSPCTCYEVELPDGRKLLLCWAKGIIGMLSKEQIEKYCPKKIIKPAPERLKRRYIKFIEAAKKTAGLPITERIRMMRRILREEE